MSTADALLDGIRNEMSAHDFKARVVIPGDDLANDIRPFAKKIRIGKGIQNIDESVKATKAGVFQFRTPNRFWVENSQRRYSPVVGDAVIGVVVSKHSEEYRLNVGGPALAILPALAFDGASKRNKPNFEIGTAVYARVEVAHRDMDPEVTCVTALEGKKRDWVTGQSIFGELNGGFVFRVTLSLAKMLRSTQCTVLNCIGNVLAFEIAVGANGMVWIHASSKSETVVISNAIRNSEHLTDVQINVMCRKLLANLRTMN